MPISIADIQQKTFARARQGYDTQAVDEFLEQISTDYEAMLRKIADLKTRLTAAESKNADLTSQLEAAKAAVSKAQSQAAQAAQAAQEARSSAPVTTKSSAYIATEEQLSQALIAAQQTAERVVNEAKTNADRIRSEAETQARKVIRQALDEKQSELDEIERLKKSREDFRTEYMALIQKFLDAAQTNFPASMMSSTPSGSEASASANLPISNSRAQSATPYGARIDTSGMDDLD
jgi:cell division initiation protein